VVAVLAPSAIQHDRRRDQYIYRLTNAKRPDTRTRRIAQFVAMLARGETIYPQRRTLES
jgi:uncharacterized protein YdeI (YjbR/CyaY-like superfamily)